MSRTLALRLARMCCRGSVDRLPFDSMESRRADRFFELSFAFRR